ncbi:hypothetical protein MJ546_33710, partial [Burkholderia gladioli]
MSDKLSDEQILHEFAAFKVDGRSYGTTYDIPQRFLVSTVRRILAASPAPAIPAETMSDQQILDIAKRVTPAFRESPASCIALVREAFKVAPAIPAHTRAWIEKLIDRLDVEGATTISADDASCYVNALREMLDARSAPAISESDVLIVPTRVGELIDSIKRDGLLKRAAEFSEMCRLIDAARKGEKS